MAEESKPTKGTESAEGGVPGAPEQKADQPEGKDYKALYESALAESRKWEGRSKANLKELEELKRQPPKDRAEVAVGYVSILR